MRWVDDTWSAFDVETTGFRKHSRIIELAVVTFEQGVPVRRWSSLFNPADVDWGDPEVIGALEVNHITREQLRGAPRFEDMLPYILLEFSTEVWVAHNFRFDQKMIGQEFDRLRARARPPSLRVCTMELARKLNDYQSGNTLADVAQRFNVSLTGAHRAVADAEACGFVLASMVRGSYVPTDNDAMQRFCEAAKKKS